VQRAPNERGATPGVGPKKEGKVQRVRWRPGGGGAGAVAKKSVGVGRKLKDEGKEPELTVKLDEGGEAGEIKLPERGWRSVVPNTHFPLGGGGAGNGGVLTWRTRKPWGERNLC